MLRTMLKANAKNMPTAILKYTARICERQLSRRCEYMLKTLLLTMPTNIRSNAKDNDATC